MNKVVVKSERESSEAAVGVECHLLTFMVINRLLPLEKPRHIYKPGHKLALCVSVRGSQSFSGSVASTTELYVCTHVHLCLCVLIGAL